MRPCDPKSIGLETIKWWDDIASGQLTFVNGLPMLSEFLPAYIPGHVIVVSGYTSAGKSQLLAQMSIDIAETHKAELLVISVEDTRMEKMMSIVGAKTGIHKRGMLLGSIQGNEGRLTEALGEISEWPISIYDDKYTFVEIEEAIIKHNPRVVIIDYVQNLLIDGDGIYAKMSKAGQWIQQIASKYMITMIIASQIDNESAKNPDSPIISLKGAGELAAVAHTVLQLRKGRKEGEWHKVEIHIKKNKAFGNCGELKCSFNSTWTAIENEQPAHVGFHVERLKSRGKSED